MNDIIPSDPASDSAKDPLTTIAGILKDTDLSDEHKKALIRFSQQRFRHRRIMAYLALWTIVGSLGALLLGVFFVSDFGAALQGGVGTLITWIEGFLAAIVAAYYGISAWRPTS